MVQRQSRLCDGRIVPVAAGQNVTGINAQLLLASITVTSPNGGETWSVGSSHDITWTSTGTIADVKIEYSTDSGTSYTTVIASTANTGSYAWTVPGTLSTTCMVRVSDAADGDPLDASDAVFTIVSPITDSITVTAPNGGGRTGRWVQAMISPGARPAPSPTYASNIPPTTAAIGAMLSPQLPTPAHMPGPFPTCLPRPAHAGQRCCQCCGKRCQ